MILSSSLFVQKQDETLVYVFMIQMKKNLWNLRSQRMSGLTTTVICDLWLSCCCERISLDFLDPWVSFRLFGVYRVGSLPLHPIQSALSEIRNMCGYVKTTTTTWTAIFSTILNVLVKPRPMNTIWRYCTIKARMRVEAWVRKLCVRLRERGYVECWAC
jgi:hypothetical protein